MSLCFFRQEVGQHQCRLKALSLRPLCETTTMFYRLCLGTLCPLLCRICIKCPHERLQEDLASSVCRWRKIGSLPWKPEHTITINESILGFFLGLFLSTFLSLSLWTKLTHSTLTLYLYYDYYIVIYLHSYLKYLCVYKLKIISSYPFSKWHLQGKGCVGLRFLIALQEPIQKGSTEHWLCVCATSSELIKDVSLSHESYQSCVFFISREDDSWSWSLGDGQYKDIVCMNTHGYHTEMH